METLIETFKRFYWDYRQTAGVDESFTAARETLAHHVILRIRDLAEGDSLQTIRALVREYQEIEESSYGSNDSVKERLEREYGIHLSQSLH